jgi:hypothetical protein
MKMSSGTLEVGGWRLEDVGCKARKKEEGKVRYGKRNVLRKLAGGGENGDD